MKSRWTIGKKLIASFLSVAAITLLLGIVGYYGVSEGGKAIHEIGEVRLPSIESLLVISEAQTAVDGAENALLSRDLDGKARQEKYETFAAAWKRADEAWKVYEPLPQTEEETRVWREFVPAWEKWKQDHEAYVALAREFEALGIPDPVAMQRDLERFAKDHYKLEGDVLNHVLHGAECPGGDDARACAYGRWVAAFDSTNPELRRIIDAARPSHDAFHAAVGRAKELAAEGKKEEASNLIYTEMADAAAKTFAGFGQLLEEVAKADQVLDKMTQQALTTNAASFTASEELLLRLVDINTTVAAETIRTATTQAAFLNVFSVVAMIVGVVAALALGILISRSINKALRRIATGLSAGADQTASAAGQVSSASQSLAQGASEQAAALEETSSSMEEMSSMTTRNAENAEQAAALMKQAKECVDGMAQATGEMSEAIANIKASSGETAKIIKTIEEISFQTNLLALNAAVEAARAGEAGKGFAVVAEEVRNLAQRAADAARNTATMIEGSVKNADNGVAVTQRVAEAVEKTVENAGKVNDLVAEIAAASQEQAQGIGQINTAMSQMDQVTQSNAANAEESASAPEELNAQAEELRRMVLDLQALVGGAGAERTSTASTGSPTRTARPEPRRYAPTGKKPSATPRMRAENADQEDWLTAESDTELAHF